MTFLVFLEPHFSRCTYLDSMSAKCAAKMCPWEWEQFCTHRRERVKRHSQPREYETWHYLSAPIYGVDCSDEIHEETLSERAWTIANEGTIISESYPILPYELLVEVFQYLDPMDLLIRIRPVAKMFKSAANIILQRTLFFESEIEVHTFFHPLLGGRTSRLPTTSSIHCRPELNERVDGDILTWVGDADCASQAFHKIPCTGKPIFLIPSPSWTWFRPVEFYDYEKLHLQDFIELETSEGRRTVKSHTANQIGLRYPPWRLQYLKILDQTTGDNKYQLTVRLPLFVLVGLSRAYQRYWWKKRVWQSEYLESGTWPAAYYEKFCKFSGAFEAEGKKDPHSFPVVTREKRDARNFNNLKGIDEGTYYT